MRSADERGQVVDARLGRADASALAGPSSLEVAQRAEQAAHLGHGLA